MYPGKILERFLFPPIHCLSNRGLLNSVAGSAVQVQYMLLLSVQHSTGIRKTENAWLAQTPYDYFQLLL